MESTAGGDVLLYKSGFKMSRLPKAVPSTKTVTTITRPRSRGSGPRRQTTVVKTVNPTSNNVQRSNRRTRRRRRAANVIREQVTEPGNPVAGFTQGVIRHAAQHGFNSLVASYMACLANPFEHKSRIPDIYAKRTSVFHSIQQIDLPVSFSATPEADDGRFSFAAKPIMGQTDVNSHFQIAAVDCTKLTKWDSTVNWADPNLYLSNVDGIDPRIDINAKFLAGASPTYYKVTSTAGLTPAIPFNTAAYAIGPASTGSYTVESDANYFWINLPPGSYEIGVQASVVGTGASDAQINTLGVNVAANPTNVTPTGVERPPSNITNGATSSLSWSGVATTTTSNQRISYQICNSGTNTISTTVNVTRFVIVISPVNTTVSSYNGTGIIERIRPVGMAALVSFIGHTIYDGGQILIGQYDGDYLDSNFYNKSQSGQAQRYETLGTIEDTHVAKRLRDGAYHWWRPRDIVSNEFKTIPEMNDYSFPGFICSGKVTRPPNTTTAFVATYVRVRLAIAYEYVTQSTAQDSETCSGSTAMMELALRAMQGQPQAMDNPKHESWFENLFRDAGKFIRTNQSWLGPLATGALTLL